jgi:hypothetical protein
MSQVAVLTSHMAQYIGFKIIKLSSPIPKAESLPIPSQTEIKISIPSSEVVPAHVISFLRFG